jgi:hypothetical protein
LTETRFPERPSVTPRLKVLPGMRLRLLKECWEQDAGKDIKEAKTSPGEQDSWNPLHTFYSLVLNTVLSRLDDISQPPLHLGSWPMEWGRV